MKKAENQIEYERNLWRDLLIHEVGVIEAYQLYNTAKKEYIKLRQLMYED